jgi:hypothetical protein
MGACVSRFRERRPVRRPLVTVARWAGTLVRWRVHRALPGLAGAAAVSVGAGELAGHIFGRGLAPWVTLGVGGMFALWIGAAINQVPHPPSNDG